jgi:tRNA/rRNA methyltransferase
MHMHLHISRRLTATTSTSAHPVVSRAVGDEEVWSATLSDDGVSQAFAGYAQPEAKTDAFRQAKALPRSSFFPCIVLVNPTLEQNVGAVARCMLNYGLSELRVVNPACDIHSEQARALSSGAFDVLLHARVFASLTDCVADLTRVLATSDRKRHMAQLVYTPEKAAHVALGNQQDPQQRTAKVGILFGTERSGLSNDDMAFADALITIPTFGHFSSLNLAQSVNIIGYEIWKEYKRSSNSLPPEEWLQPVKIDRLATRHEVSLLCDRLEEQLTIKEFQVDPVKRKLCYRNTRNIFNRVSGSYVLNETCIRCSDCLAQMHLTQCETNSLHGMLSVLQRPNAPGLTKAARRKES